MFPPARYQQSVICTSRVDVNTIRPSGRNAGSQSATGRGLPSLQMGKVICLTRRVAMSIV